MKLSVTVFRTLSGFSEHPFKVWLSVDVSSL